MEYSLLETPLFSIHKQLKAQMAGFAGWNMPIQYTTIIEEHLNTRQKAGLFDISHMGEIVIKGKDASIFLQYIMTNDVSKLLPGFCIYSNICYETGFTVDDCFIYMFSQTEYWLIVNASNIKKDFEWVKKNSTSYNVQIEDISDSIAKLDLQGPLSPEILKRFLNLSEIGLKRFEFKSFDYDNEKLIISRTGYTGEDGFEIYFNKDMAVSVWQKLIEDGQVYGLKPAGLGARNTLRLEACYSLYGHELGESISPVQGGVGWVVKESKGGFIGQDVLAKQKKEGTAQVVAAFEMTGKSIARDEYKVFHNNQEAGVVTSGSFSPTLRKAVGLCLVKSSLAKEGTILQIQIRDQFYDAVIVKRPFYKYRGGKNVQE